MTLRLNFEIPPVLPYAHFQKGIERSKTLLHAYKCQINEMRRRIDIIPNEHRPEYLEANPYIVITLIETEDKAKNLENDIFDREKHYLEMFKPQFEQEIAYMKKNIGDVIKRAFESSDSGIRNLAKGIRDFEKGAYTEDEANDILNYNFKRLIKALK